MRKLVRDKIPSMMKIESGETHGDDLPENIRKMSGWEYDYALQLKLHEEWQEAWEDPCPEEFGDCLEVLMSAAKRHGIAWSDIEDARTKKVEKKGSFECGWELTLK